MPDEKPAHEQAPRAPEGDLESPPDPEKIAKRRAQMLAPADIVGPGAELQAQKLAMQTNETVRRAMRPAVGVTTIDRRGPIDIGGKASPSHDNPPALRERQKLPKTFENGAHYKVRLAMPVLYHGTTLSPAHEVTLLGSAINEIIAKPEYKDAFDGAEKSV